MKRPYLAICMLFMSANVFAQKLEITEWVDIFVDTCVGSGSTMTVSGNIDASGNVSLRKATATGQVAGGLSLNRQQVRLLTDGISSKLTTVAADQADKVRACLEPLRRNLLRVMNQQLGGPSGAVAANVPILSPEEDRVLVAVATTKGSTGRIGVLVSADDLAPKSGMSEIRLSYTLARLERALLVSRFGSSTNLTPQAETYLVESGLVK